MKLWLISQDKNDGYDTYDSAVVAAETEEDATKVHPRGDRVWDSDKMQWYTVGRGADKPRYYEDGYSPWVAPVEVLVKCIGEAAPSIAPNTVICASFNAG